MKKILYIILAIVLVSACAGNKEAKELFASVESVIDEHPDSALALLERAKTHKDAWSKAQRMRFELLHAKAQNKAYVDFTTDSVMKEVVEYYDGHGTPNEQMEAHYLLGCTYRDMGESPMALSCYLDATEKADTLSEDCDFGALMRIWGQVANEFDRQAMPYEELEANQKFGKYALLSKDTLNFIVGIELRKRAYNMIGDTVKVLDVVEKAISLYREKGYEEYAAKAVSLILPIYINNGNLSKASEYMEYFEKQSGYFGKDGEIINGQEQYYYTKGMYYEAANMLDSAEFYYRKLLDISQVWNVRYDAYKGLLSVFDKNNIYDSIPKYSKMKERAFEMAYSNLYTKEMFNAEGMFNYARNQRIAIDKEQESIRNKMRLTMFGVFTFVVAIITLVAFRKYKVRKKEELTNMMQLYSDTKSRYDAALAEQSLMENDFDTFRAQKAEEITSLQHKWEDVSAKYERMLSKDLHAEICDTEVARNIRKKERIRPGMDTVISDEELTQMFALFKEKMPHFYTSVLANFQLSSQEHQIAALTMLNFTPKTIAMLLNTSLATISNAKMSINIKLYNERSAKTLYDNLCKKVVAELNEDKTYTINN